MKRKPYTPKPTDPGQTVGWTHHGEARTGQVWEAGPTTSGRRTLWVIPDHRLEDEASAILLTVVQTRAELTFRQPPDALASSAAYQHMLADAYRTEWSDKGSDPWGNALPESIHQRAQQRAADAYRLSLRELVAS
jgi:hypothetical protein